jgi:hypothetical protein
LAAFGGFQKNLVILLAAFGYFPRNLATLLAASGRIWPDSGIHRLHFYFRHARLVVSALVRAQSTARRSSVQVGGRFFYLFETLILFRPRSHFFAPALPTSKMLIESFLTPHMPRYGSSSAHLTTSINEYCSAVTKWKFS